MGARSGPPRLLVKLSHPVALALSGRRWFPLWAVMHHVGRRSGRDYSVPIAVVPTTRTDIVLIGLPWGERTNWAQNVLAAGRATMTWRGQEIEVVDPRTIGVEDAVELARGPVRRVLASGRIRSFLLLDR